MPSSAPPRALAFGVACVAGAMLLFELAVTRLFSVLFFYHFSFFAISLVMSGLVIGGIASARWNVREMSERAYLSRLSALGWMFSAAMLASLSITLALPAAGATPSLTAVALQALVFLPGLVAAGSFLAAAFARDKTWIGALYASDLIAAACACIGAIALMRIVEGPAVLLVPSLLAAAAGLITAPARSLHRVASALLAAVALIALIANAAAGGYLLHLASASRDKPLVDRWNDYSRIQVVDGGADGRYIVIDKSAATVMKHVPAEADGGPPLAQAWWKAGPQYTVYRVGRPVANVAIIGVGGGRDLLPPLAYEAAHVDGYELNGILVDLLQREFVAYNATVTRPEVSLIHQEARVGIAHSGNKYDVIQASLIDTWAATSAGGFVLSENGLYTRDGWRTFLSKLSDRGVLTMTRWYVPDAPAETQRLVALAATALGDAGIADTRAHVMLISSKRADFNVAFTMKEVAAMGTILVSKSPFASEEVARVKQACAEQNMVLLAAPGIAAQYPVIDRLLDTATRRQAIDSSPYNIAPPTDLQPYFFLQLRPSDVLKLSGKSFGPVTEITFNGVRVLMLLGGCALLLTLGIVLLSVTSLPGSATRTSGLSVYRWMTLYFLAIGFGYILVQLGLHQRLIIIVGHPTFALSIVLFSMLLGTGIGAASASRLFEKRGIRGAGAAILGALLLLLLCFPAFPAFEQIESQAVRLGAIGLMLGGVGFVLGFAFPLGIATVAPTGEWAVQKMWAINGAASIAGSVLAAFIGLTLGSPFVIAAAFVCYAVAVIAGSVAEMKARGASSPGPELAVVAPARSGASAAAR
ncbi:MAG: hypothetical protein E6H78_08395 [Betaproteobacteria bacterium]|nr:MAG: hypothetical protein E6H78_08395 [Betaproteobacteria bacterium]